MDKIELGGMEFMACHGCLPEEKTEPQLFIVDATLYLPLGESGKNDDINATVDYPKAFELVKQIVTGKSYDLIEALAYNLAKELCREFPVVRRVKITVHKPQSPLVGKLKDVSVTLTRKQTKGR